MKNIWNDKKTHITIIALTILSLVVAIIEYNSNHEFIASIFCNLFAGMVTGCTIAFISAAKNRKKGKYILLKSAYKSVFDYNVEFLQNKEYMKYLLDDESLYESIYSKLSYLKFINEYIEKYKNEYLEEGKLAEIFVQKFSYKTDQKEKEFIKLHEDLKNNVYNSKKHLLELVKKYEIDVIKLNVNIQMEINKCNTDIYQIEQSFL